MTAHRGIGVDWAARRPLWWRVLAWVAVSALTGFAAPVLWRQIAAGVATALAAIGLQRAEDDEVQGGGNAVFAATVLGYAACALAPAGLGYVAIGMAASKVPFAYSRRAATVFVIVDSLALSVFVAWESGIWKTGHSVVGLLAGLCIPLFAQRAAQQQELVNERNRAQALLAEVEAGRDAEATAATLRERGRIARDMHDLLAHTLAGLSLQLQAARTVATKAGVSSDVLAPIDRAAQLARSGLDEARSAVGALRELLVLGALPALVERYGATLASTGPARALSEEAGSAVYRAVQEALTNASRYAPGSPARVEVSWRAELTVTITDDGLAGAATSNQGTGLGLAGMGERIAQIGGRLRAGPRIGGGWQVQIWVPLPEAK